MAEHWTGCIPVPARRSPILRSRIEISVECTAELVVAPRITGLSATPDTQPSGRGYTASLTALSAIPARRRLGQVRGQITDLVSVGNQNLELIQSEHPPLRTGRALLNAVYA